jgi:hypothetical protein
MVSVDVLLLPPVLKKRRRGVRVVEGARLESVYSGNAIAGSNPALSAKQSRCPKGHFLFSGMLKFFFHIE